MGALYPSKLSTKGSGIKPTTTESTGGCPAGGLEEQKRLVLVKMDQEAWKGTGFASVTQECV